MTNTWTPPFVATQVEPVYAPPENIIGEIEEGWRVYYAGRLQGAGWTPVGQSRVAAEAHIAQLIARDGDYPLFLYPDASQWTIVGS